MKKIIALFTSATIILSTVTAFASQKTIETLTVEKAANRAIEYSSDIKKINEDKALSEDKVKSAKERYWQASTTINSLNEAVSLMQLEATDSLYNANAQLKKDQLKFSITKFFASVLTAEDSLALYDDQLKLAKKSLDISQKKLELGLISKNTYDIEKNNYAKSVNERKLKEDAISNAYISLNKLMGTTLTTRYELELDLRYVKMKDLHLEGYILDAIEKSVSVKAQRDAVEIAKYQRSVFSPYSISSSEAAAGIQSTAGVETTDSLDAKITQAGRAVTDAKDAIRETLTNIYNSIHSLETQYDSNLLEYENMKTQLKLMETQLSIGKITEFEVEKYKFQIKQMENTLKNQVFDHQIKVYQFENPAFM